MTYTEHTDSVNSLRFSPDGTCFASASSDLTVRVWSASTELDCSIECLKGHTGPVRSLCFSPDGGKIATGSDDTCVIVFGE